MKEFFQYNDMSGSIFGGKDKIREFLQVYKRIQAHGTRKGKRGKVTSVVATMIH